MNKITILGGTASGKTTLANKLGDRLHIPITHLDKIFWKEKGGIRQDAFVIELDQIMKSDRWIIEGSMHRSKTLHMRLDQADTIIFYDIPLCVALWRQTKRFFKYYNKVRPDMGGDNIQKYPFTWKEIQHMRNQPMNELYSKILAHKDSKKIVIIKNNNDERAFLQSLK